MDIYGGWEGMKFKATGYFHLVKDKRWWLVTPDGNAFLSLGINHLHTDLWKQPYNEKVWVNRFGLSEGYAFEDEIPTAVLCLPAFSTVSGMQNRGPFRHHPTCLAVREKDPHEEIVHITLLFLPGLAAILGEEDRSSVSHGPSSTGVDEEDITQGVVRARVL